MNQLEPEGFAPPPDEKGATKWLLLAISRIPTLVYALGVVGLVAAAAISTAFFIGYWQYALLGGVAVFAGMVLVRVYAANKPKAATVDVSHAFTVLVWTCVTAFILMVAIGIAGFAKMLFWDNGPSQSSSRKVAIQVSCDGKVIESPFRISFCDEAGHKYPGVGDGGLAQVEIPASVHVLKEVAVEIPCFKQIPSGPVEILEGKPVVVKMEKIAMPLRDALHPSLYPDIKMLMEKKDFPDDGALKKPPAIERRNAVFECENRTGEFLRILLHSFDGKRAENPWRVVNSDPCKEIDWFNDFKEEVGTYAVVIRRENGKCKFVKCVDFYAKERTRLVVEKKGDELDPRIE